MGLLLGGYRARKTVLCQHSLFRQIALMVSYFEIARCDADQVSISRVATDDLDRLWPDCNLLHNVFSRYAGDSFELASVGPSE